jgi:hypothetical protein
VPQVDFRARLIVRAANPLWDLCPRQANTANMAVAPRVVYRKSPSFRRVIHCSSYDQLLTIRLPHREATERIVLSK